MTTKPASASVIEFEQLDTILVSFGNLAARLRAMVAVICAVTRIGGKRRRTDYDARRDF